MGVCVLKTLAGTFTAVRVCVCFGSEGGLSFFCATEIPVSYEIKPAYWRCKFIERFKSGWSIVLKAYGNGFPMWIVSQQTRDTAERDEICVVLRTRLSWILQNSQAFQADAGHSSFRCISSVLATTTWTSGRQSQPPHSRDQTSVYKPAHPTSQEMTQTMTQQTSLHSSSPRKDRVYTAVQILVTSVLKEKCSLGTKNQ